MVAGAQAVDHEAADAGGNTAQVGRRHRDGYRGGYLQRGLSQGEAGIAERRGAPDPGRITEHQPVPGVAIDAQRVRRAGEVQHFQRREPERVVAAAAEVDGLDLGQLVVGDLGQVQHHASATERQGIGAAAAVEVGEAQVCHAQHIVAGAAMHHIQAAQAVNAVVALAGDHHVGAGAAGEHFPCAGALLGHRGAEVAAEDDVALAGIGLGVAVCVAVPRADQQVVETVAVDVATPSHRAARCVPRPDTVEHEAAGSRRDRDQVDAGTKAEFPAEYHEGLAGIGAAGVRGGADCADHQVVDAVAVDVARRGHRPARVVVGVLAMDHETTRAAGHCAQVDAGAKAAGLAIHHIAVAGIGFGIAGSAGEWRADHDV